MKLERTKDLITKGIERSDPMGSFIHVLDSTIELLEIKENDFSWSSWDTAEAAISEVKEIKEKIRSNILPDKLKVSVLFAPTGPLQEVSLSSGWADTYIKLADRYDEVERLVWKNKQGLTRHRTQWWQTLASFFSNIFK